MLYVSPLRDLARQCRLIAAMIDDPETSALLLRMAAQYDQQAKDMVEGRTRAFEWPKASETAEASDKSLCGS